MSHEYGGKMKAKDHIPEEEIYFENCIVFLKSEQSSDAI